MEDISEQKELEELEDGQCGGDEEEEESEEEEPPSPPHTPTAKREPEKLTRTNSKPRYVWNVPVGGCGLRPRSLPAVLQVREGSSSIPAILWL